MYTNPRSTDIEPGEPQPRALSKREPKLSSGPGSSGGARGESPNADRTAASCKTSDECVAPKPDERLPAPRCAGGRTRQPANVGREANETSRREMRLAFPVRSRRDELNLPNTRRKEKATEMDLKELRRSAGLTQQALTTQAGCSLAYVTMLEGGLSPPQFQRSATHPAGAGRCASAR